ncbi:MAG: AmmeMemoRadiSam system radical SAM enzyme [Candidatus Bipolaricaulota bacterium]|nr:AmmeMemoRadiSam system radical SAM enzyme [Candidatus Bipolaricaulota bacterium]
MEPWVREALLQERLPGGKARCLTCERRCLLLPGQRGFCRTRENRDGRIYTLVYGLLSAISLNPMEKKPFYHLHPGDHALTCGTWSCNFPCPWCQNWEISKSAPDPARGEGYFSPRDFVELARRSGAQGVSLSFNEPTLLLEWAVELFPLAHEAGLHTDYVTNGYMTEEALELLVASGLDGVNIDLKGSGEAVRRFCQADVEKVWRNARFCRARGVHVEVTTLVIPGVNDSEEDLRGIAARIAQELGPSTPWHVTRYFPAYAFRAPPTPVAVLERAQEIGHRAGLKYVYVGNVPGHPGQHTYCPGCRALLLEREGVALVRRHVPGPRCPRCGEFIPLREGKK